MGIAGTADFAQRLSERLGRPGQAHEQGRERNATDAHLAERLVQDWMNTTGWTEAQLAARAKGDAEKATLAARLRRETPMTRAWIAHRLSMGSVSYVSHLTTAIALMTAIERLSIIRTDPSSTPRRYGSERRCCRRVAEYHPAIRQIPICATGAAGPADLNRTGNDGTIDRWRACSYE